MNISRRSLVVGSTALMAAGPAEKLKVGFVYVGPVGDFGWSYQHDQGRKALEQALGDRVTTSFVEKVPEGPDAERVIRQLASGGAGLIFTTSFGFMNSAERVAKQFPAIKFEQATGYKTAPNLAEYNARFYQGRAVCGAMAGHLSKTGIAGYVGSVPIPEVVMGVNAFTLAAQKVNPAFKTKMIWVNSWFDPGKEADAAKSLIDQGADILCQHTDSPAVMQTAQDRRVLAFGQASDMRSFGPDAQLTAITDEWGPYYVERARAVLDGSWKTQSVWMGMKEGTVVMTPYGPAATPEARAAGDAAKSGIIAGTLDPFAGPIRDKAGVERVPAGGTLTDDALLKMDWYVAGVQA